MTLQEFDKRLFIQHLQPQLIGPGQLRPRPRPRHHTMGLGRDGTCHFGAEAFELVLGHVAAHQLQRTGEHPGLPGQRQTFDDFLLALPVHAEIGQLFFSGFGELAIFLDGKKLANRIGLLFRQRLTHVQPVGIDDPLQRTELFSQFLRPARPDRRNVQLVEQSSQCRAGGKLGAQVALILNLQTMLEQIGDHLPVVRILKEAVNLVSHFEADIRQVRQHVWQCLLNPLQ
ncbi:hypothetical protein D3C87_1373540 [compost metagenome]